MEASIDVDGLDEVAELLRGLEESLGDEFESAADDIGARLRGTAAELAPYDEGRLRTSIEEVVETVGEHVVRVVVGTNVEYAPYQEFGTAVMEAQPYLRPALEAERDWIVERVEAGVSTAFDSAGFGGVDL